MSRTASSDRQTLVPSSPLLPLERLDFSIATKRSLSREFFNRIGQKRTLVLTVGCNGMLGGARCSPGTWVTELSGDMGNTSGTLWRCPMPWSETSPMDQKTQFIADYLRRSLSI